MTKGAYVGVGGVARKIKKGYVGVDGKARKIKKAYIGVGGVARPCWGGGELKYYGVVHHLIEKRNNLAATTVGGYALFGGGFSSDAVYSNTVDAYTESLVRSTPALLSNIREGLAATTVGGYAIFGGGTAGGAVDVYTTSLVHSTTRDRTEGRSNLAATTVGGYALFGGGTSSRTVEVYTGSLVLSNATSLSSAREGLAATTVGGYALFGGGSDGAAMAEGTVDAYTTSLVRSTPAPLSEERDDLAATTVGGYALFGGGLYKGSGFRASTYSSFSGTVDAYTTSLVHSTATSLSEERSELAATTVGGYALFGGGACEGRRARAIPSVGNYSGTVDAYTTSLVHSTATSLSSARGRFAATTVGDYALFGGGGDDARYDYSDAVDAYTVA